MTETVDTLNDLYTSPETCAGLVGLSYINSANVGYNRKKQGKGFTYSRIGSGAVVRDDKTRKAIESLAIPPAWQEVWISSNKRAHILATGIDEKGRKQYIYNPKWRTMRDLIKFYRLVLFGRSLPKIRRDIEAKLKLRNLSRDKVMAVMLWTLDNAYIRIGNDAYFLANDSVGLTTLTDRNVVIAGSVVTLAFTGKSGKEQQITFEDPSIARVLEELKSIEGARLFRYFDAAGDWHPISSEEINRYLHELTQRNISAKDFRTWGGTLMAFMHLINEAEPRQKKPEKAIIVAVDQAAAVLGNTRSIARASYVHPDLISVYGSKDFSKYYEKAQSQRKIAGLEPRESELCHFLELLFEREFTLLKNS